MARRGSVSMSSCVVFGLVAIGGALTGGVAAAAEPVCDFPVGKEPAIVVDLATKEVTGNLQLGRQGSAVIGFRNANPFAYDYRVTSENKPLGEPALALLGRFLFSETAQAAAATPPPTGTPPQLGPAVIAVPPGCATPPSLDEAADSAHQAGEDVQTAITNAGKSLKELLEKQDGALSKARQQTQCEGIVAAARKVSEGALTDLSTVKADIEKLDKAVKTLSDEIAVARRDMIQAGCPTTVVDARLARFVAQRELLAALVVKAREQLQELAAARGKLEAQRQAAERVLADPEYFRFTRREENHGPPAERIVKVERKEKGKDAFEQLLVTTLTFGRRRFSLSVGPVVAWLDPREYKVIQGFVLDAKGEPVLDANDNPTLGRVVGLEDDSEERVLGMLSLNAYMGGIKWKKLAAFATLGVTDSEVVEGLDPEYLFGVSIGPSDGSFLITVGAYTGRVEELRPGFYEGKHLPDDLTAVPVRVDRHWSAAVGISYHFR